MTKEKLNKLNLLIIVISFIAMIFGITFSIIDLDDINFLNSFGIVLLGAMAFSGILSVVFSNMKWPMAVYLLSLFATLYKLAYPIFQLATGSDSVNTTVIYGQTLFLFTSIFQLLLWKKWNRNEGGTFISRSFNGKSKYWLIFIFVIMYIELFLISIFLFGNNIIMAIMDITGGVTFTLGAIFMTFGNIWCFLFFILSDINWMVWTINDLVTNPDMLAMALLTLIQVSAYLLLAITGWMSWNLDK